MTACEPSRQVPVEQHRELLGERCFIDFVSADLEAVEEGLVELLTCLRIRDRVSVLAVSGQIEGRSAARRLPATALRWGIVILGTAVALVLLVR